MNIPSRLKKFAQARQYGINTGDRVLDIGSGHNPQPRANVLAERYIDHDGERGGKVVTDQRDLVQSDIEQLPFETNAFDFVFAKHVIEHVDDPETALDEVMRVGKRGYIECPSLFLELLHPTREYHKWMVLEVDDTLLFQRRPDSIDTEVFGDLFEHDGVISRSNYFYGFYKQYEDLFRVRYTWDEKIHYNINPEGESRKYFDEPYTDEKLERLLKESKGGLFETSAKLLYHIIQ